MVSHGSNGNAFSPLTLSVASPAQRHHARDNAEISPLLTPVIAECVSAVSTLLAPPPQGEMAVACPLPHSQPVPLVNSTCMKATCGGALLLAGLAGYAARTYMQGPTSAQGQDTSASSRPQTVRATKQPRMERRTSPPVVRLLVEKSKEHVEKRLGGFSKLENEIVSVAMGHCGNNLNIEFWKGLIAEHSLDENKQGDKDESSRSAVYLRGGDGRPYVPRSILVDLDPSTMDKVKQSSVGRNFKPDNMVFGSSGAGNNFAKGFYTHGAELIEETQDVVRKEFENCDAPQGYHLFQSLGGGTGSGMGSLLSEKMRDDYPDLLSSTFSVFPSAKVSDVVTEPYNAVLAIHRLLDCDSTFILDNSALCDIAMNDLKVDAPRYNDLNHIINLALMGVTAPFRFTSALDSSLRRQNTSLCAFPRLHFFTLSQSPIFAKGSAQPSEMLNELNDLADVKGGGKLLAASCYYRGQYEENFSSAFDNKVSGMEKVGWIPHSTNWCHLNRAPSDSKASCTMVANSTATKHVFQKLSDKFKAMYRRKMAIHWYKGEGMDEMEFQEADKNVRDLITEYEDRQSAQDDDQADDEEDDF